ncbi:MAG: hypothetical protein GF333_03810 [Candidatus Omnitrophica bacterium]|nr:hypothetical protein [Candidatus Omnitrophota bacterium]
MKRIFTCLFVILLSSTVASLSLKADNAKIDYFKLNSNKLLYPGDVIFTGHVTASCGPRGSQKPCAYKKTLIYKDFEKTFEISRIIVEEITEWTKGSSPNYNQKIKKKEMPISARSSYGWNPFPELKFSTPNRRDKKGGIMVQKVLYGRN